MIVLKTPEWSNISALVYNNHIMIRRTKDDKIGRKYSYGPYYSAKHELGLRLSRFSSGELKWMEKQIEKYERIHQIPLIPGVDYLGIGRIKYL